MEGILIEGSLILIPLIRLTKLSTRYTNDRYPSRLIPIASNRVKIAKEQKLKLAATPKSFMNGCSIVPRIPLRPAGRASPKEVAAKVRQVDMIDRHIRIILKGNQVTTPFSNSLADHDRKHIGIINAAIPIAW
jgi:hypothetical protein